jgi:putative acetyltransferase
MSERHIETSVHIDAPPDRVWEVLADFPGYPDWNPFIRSISGTLEPGARLSVLVRDAEDHDKAFAATVLAATPHRELRWRRSLLVPGLLDIEHYFRIEPDEAGASTFEHGGIFSGVLFPLLATAHASDASRLGFEAMNAALKRVAETSAEAAPGRPRDESPSVQIEEERPDHATAVDALTRVSFGGDYEADLAERLRKEQLVIAAFVALDGARVIGHIMLSELPTELDDRLVKAACLAPLSVEPADRHKGIGAQLVRTGISAARERGYEAVFVIGDPAYYGRFGFCPRIARKIDSPFPGDGFMALELVPGALRGKKGAARYPKAFRLEA